MYPKSIQKLIEIFSKFPAVGQKTAARFAFFLLRQDNKEIENLIKAISELKSNVKHCKFCFKPFEPKNSENLCEICSSLTRDKSIICIVEKEQDLESIEKTKKFNGIYFILGELINFKKKKLEREKDLIERLKNPQKFGLIDANFKEIILALNPTPEGEATKLYLKKLLSPFSIKISTLAIGLPTGAELEYADNESLSSALENRKKL